ncbi:hypothetical protein C8034_v011148 [Colletotrichum sidae]|uniref:Uncharacterized protein n=1 Tax=Colletotrichum sidae TaxID=1347389 RepID=A0A4R8TJD0_9PEZI|nr:hypothetical protein C8034_v011148 [Colletotrichum sidae]
MTDAFPTPTATPKRKRNDGDRSLSPIYTSSEFSFQLPEAQNDEDGNASPRSKVVQKFRGLALNGGGGGVAQQHNTGTARQRQGAYDPTRDVEDHGIYNDDPFTSRKRFKVPEVEMTDADDAQTIHIPDPEVGSRPLLAPKPMVTFVTATEAADANPPITTTAINVGAVMTAQATWQRPQHLASRLQDGKGRGRRRAGTPPLRGCKKKTTVGGSAAAAAQAAQAEEDTEPQIVDPVRAALTWKDDEITVYDPEDQDDDGTGINGVGFMPTAAMAYARTQKRRLQLAEYRKREESEARARRNQRRRGSGAGINMKSDSKATSGGGGGVRKVRFMESEPSTIVTNG